MKYIQLFENFDNLEFDIKNFWFISGDIITINNVLLKLQENIRISDAIKRINQNLHKYKKCMGMFIFQESHIYNYNTGISCLSYYIIKNKDDKNIIIKKHEKLWNYKYKGEIKLINNKIIVDTFDIDIKKYNLE